MLIWPMDIKSCRYLVLCLLQIFNICFSSNIQIINDNRFLIKNAFLASFSTFCHYNVFWLIRKCINQCTFGAKNIGLTKFVGTFGATTIYLTKFEGTLGVKKNKRVYDCCTFQTPPLTTIWSKSASGQERTDLCRLLTIFLYLSLIQNEKDIFSCLKSYSFLKNTFILEKCFTRNQAQTSPLLGMSPLMNQKLRLKK